MVNIHNMNVELIDDEEDGWTYSLPPSTESLPTLAVLHASEETESSETGQSGPKVFDPVASKMVVDTSSQLSSNSSSNTKNKEVKGFPKDPSTSSLASSISLQSPFIAKSTPAYPHITREDANSTISREAQIEDKKDEYKFASSKRTFNDLANSAQMQRESLDEEGKDPQTPKSPNDMENEKISDLPGILTPSPKVISYRKSKRSISTGSIQPEQYTPKEAFDSRLYVDEFYNDTQYRYATMKRNTDFHQLFRSLDLTYRLIDDFSCALSREILLQGRIYVTEHSICFNSNLLGWVTNLVIPLEDIIRFEKKSTAGLFPNGISIETKESKHNFASFLSRDSTFDFMKCVWEKATGKTMEDEPKQLERYTIDENGVVSDNSLSYPTNSPKFESYILSIDEDNERTNPNDDDDEEITSIRDLSSQLNSEKGRKVVKFKDNVKYKNSGPDFHPPTNVPTDYVVENNEIELCDEILDAPLGIVFDILFGSNDSSFQKRFIESQNGSEISELEKFCPVDENESNLERSYVYRKALGYSIGPKSTKCEVTETIEKFDLADYVIVLNKTTTPDVPLGNSFAVKTRYCLSWYEENKTKLRMSYFIEWTGGSWIKSVIEKQSLSGQNTATKALIESLKEEIERTTYLTEGSRIKEEVLVENPVKEEKVAEEILPQKIVIPVNNEQYLNKFINTNIVYICCFFLTSLILILFLQLRMFRLVKESNDLMRDQILIDAQVLHTINAITKESGIEYKGTDNVSIDQESSSLWSFVEDKHNRKLNDLEKLEYLTFQIGALRGREYEIKKNKNRNTANVFSDIKKQVEEFGYRELLKFDRIREALSELL